MLKMWREREKDLYNHRKCAWVSKHHWIQILYLCFLLSFCCSKFRMQFSCFLFINAFSWWQLFNCAYSGLIVEHCSALAFVPTFRVRSEHFGHKIRHIFKESYALTGAELKRNVSFHFWHYQFLQSLLYFLVQIQDTKHQMEKTA